MNLWSGLALLFVAPIFIWTGRPNNEGRAFDFFCDLCSSRSISACHFGFLCLGRMRESCRMVCEVIGRPKGSS